MRLDWICHRNCWRVIGGLLMLAIVALSLLPPALLPGMPPQTGSDKALHASAYFVLAAWYVPLWQQRYRGWAYGLAFIALGITLECLQGFTATRMGEWRDAVANSVGVVLGSSLVWTRWARVLGQKR